MGFFSPKNTPENAVKAQIDAKLAFINDKYTEIGRFVKLRMADKIEEPEVKNLIAQIDATLEELKNLNEQLLTIRGMKLCSGCGHEIPVNMAFCPNCGTKIERPQPEPEPQPTQKVCPECGAAVDEDDVFCTNCGARVDSEESSEKDDEQTESEPTDTQQ